MNDARLRLFECLFSATSSDDSAARHEAYEQLALAGGLSADEAAYFLAHTTDTVRGGMASHLEALTTNDRKLRERCIIQFCSDPVAAVRSGVCNSIRRPDDLSADVFARMAALVGDEAPYVRTEALDLLSRARPGNAIVTKALQDAFADENWSVRISVIGVLRERGVHSDKQQRFVEGCLNEGDLKIRTDAAGVILTHDPKGALAREAAILALRERKTPAFHDACDWCSHSPGNADREIVQLLFESLDSDELFRPYQPMRTLQRLGDAALPAAFQNVTHPNPNVRARATRLIRMAKSRSPAAIDVFRHAYFNDPSPFVRLEAAVGLIGTGLVEPHMGDVALSCLLAESYEISWRAADCLMRLPVLPGHATIVIASAIRSDNDLTALHALALVRKRRMSDRKILDAVMDAASSRWEEVSDSARAILRSIAIHPKRWVVPQTS